MDDLIRWLRAQLDEDERDAPAVDDLSDRFDSVRALRDVAAKRAIVDLHAPAVGWDRVARCRTCVSDRGSGYQEDWEPDETPCATLRLLALPYADRPGYRDEWRP